MKCSECTEELEEGFFFVNRAGRWSKTKPKRIANFSSDLLLYRIDFTKKKNWARPAYRCHNCKTVTFSYE